MQLISVTIFAVFRLCFHYLPFRFPSFHVFLSVLVRKRKSFCVINEWFSNSFIVIDTIYIVRIIYYLYSCTILFSLIFALILYYVHLVILWFIVIFVFPLLCIRISCYFSFIIINVVVIVVVTSLRIVKSSFSPNKLNGSGDSDNMAWLKEIGMSPASTRRLTKQ